MLDFCLSMEGEYRTDFFGLLTVVVFFNRLQHMPFWRALSRLDAKWRYIYQKDFKVCPLFLVCKDNSNLTGDSGREGNVQLLFCDFVNKLWEVFSLIKFSSVGFSLCCFMAIRLTVYQVCSDDSKWNWFSFGLYIFF